jgi:polyisoprenoid-binding protein YceI
MKSISTHSMLSTLLVAVAIGLATPAHAESATPGKYKIDPAHSTVEFSVSHLGISHLVGRFDTFEGDLNLTPNGKSDVSVTIQTASVDSNHQKRDEHLRSPDFFNSKQFPVMRFVSRKVSYNAAGEPVRVDGDLELHGVTKPVTLAVKPVGAGKDPWGGYRSGYTATSTLKRSDFGMNFMPGGIGDDIALTLQIEAIKQ